MRLYTRVGVAKTVDPVTGKEYTADDDGGFDLDDDFADRIRGFHSGGKPMWETDIERQRRLWGEEQDRRKDPATLLSAVEQLIKAAQGVAPAPSAEGKAPARRGPRRAAGSDSE